MSFAFACGTRRLSPGPTAGTLARNMEAEPKARILVVDDTAENLEVLVGILRAHGFLLNLARNGRQALDIARRTAPT
ncbi:MAG: hypothetical protein M5U12_35345 [Verrucomicrobia bacterium]|nr:hypothetical protein [Verrucomicrobiota bacterium]